MPKQNQRLRVWRNEIRRTSGGLRREDLMLNRHGKIVSKRKSLAATGANNLGQWLRKKGDTFEGKPKGFKAEEQKPKPKPKKQAPPKKPAPKPKPKPVPKKVAPKKVAPPKPKPKPKLKVIPKKMHVLKKKASEAAKQQQAAARKRPAAKPKMIDMIDLSSPKKPAKKKKLSFLERLKLKGLA